MAKYKLYLIGGQVVDVVCSEDSVNEVSEAFALGKGVLLFDNGEFKVEHVSGLEYVE